MTLRQDNAKEAKRVRELVKRGKNSHPVLRISNAKMRHKSQKYVLSGFAPGRGILGFSSAIVLGDVMMRRLVAREEFNSQHGVCYRIDPATGERTAINA